VCAFLFDRPHIWLVNEFGSLDHGLLFQLGLEKSLEFIARSSERVLTRSKAIQQTLFPGLAAPKVETVYRYIPPPKAEDLIPAEGAPGFENPQAFKLLLSGTISEGKGQEDAVRALRLLLDRGCGPLELLMPGGAHPEYLARLQTLIKELGLESSAKTFHSRTRFTRSRIRRMPCWSVPAWKDMGGRAGSDAVEKTGDWIAAGGNLEMIQDGETGLLYPPGDIGALAAQIERLMKDPGLRARLAEAGFAHVSRNLARKNSAGRVHAILRSLSRREVTGPRTWNTL
jgi:glycosyltransferase involved in cell wall biosynthesis